MTKLAQSYYDLPPEELVALSPQELFEVAGKEVATRWQGILTEAQNFMASRKGEKTLIIVCAQHPLKNGMEPGDEFRLRLQTAIDVRTDILNKGKSTPIIYVPGSIHKPDLIDLATAGTTWLAQQGVTESVYGKKTNEFYKGADSQAAHKGIYGCCDEAYVASRITKDDNDIGKVILIASTNQTLRMQLHLLANDIIPTQTIVVHPTSSYHAPVTEVNDNIPSVLLAADPTLQSADEEVPKMLRKLRVPGLDQA